MQTPRKASQHNKHPWSGPHRTVRQKLEKLREAHRQGQEEHRKNGEHSERLPVRVVRFARTRGELRIDQK